MPIGRILAQRQTRAAARSCSVDALSTMFRSSAVFTAVIGRLAIGARYVSSRFVSCAVRGLFFTSQCVATYRSIASWTVTFDVSSSMPSVCLAMIDRTRSRACESEISRIATELQELSIVAMHEIEGLGAALRDLQAEAVLVPVALHAFLRRRQCPDRQIGEHSPTLRPRKLSSPYPQTVARLRGAIWCNMFETRN